MISYLPEAKLGGGCISTEIKMMMHDQDVIFDQLDATTGMGTETFAIAFEPEESILHVGGV